MKTSIGWVFLGSGMILSAWGAFHCLTGSSKVLLDPLPVSAMTGGLAGLALLVFGFVWVRD